MHRSQKNRYVLLTILLALLTIAPLSFAAFAHSEKDAEGKLRGTTSNAVEAAVEEDAEEPQFFDDDNRDVDDEFEDEDSEFEDAYRDDLVHDEWDEDEEQWDEDEEEDWGDDEEEDWDEDEEEDWDEDEEDDRWHDEEDESIDLIERARGIAEIGESKSTAAAFAIELLSESMELEEMGYALRKMLEAVDDPSVRRVIRLHLAKVYREIDREDEMLHQLIELCK